MDWVSKGGVLIGIGNANRFLADPNVDLLAIRREDAVVEGNSEASDDAGNESEYGELPPTVPGSYVTEESEYQDLITPEQESPDSVAGVLVKADVDGEHWLGAGVAPALNVLIRGSDVYTPIRLDKGVNVATFRAADELLASGYIWDENRRQLAYKPFAVAQPVERGHVVAFTQDPNVRAYLDGLNVIFMNAIFRGAAHARLVRPTNRQDRRFGRLSEAKAPVGCAAGMQRINGRRQDVAGQPKQSIEPRHPPLLFLRIQAGGVFMFQIYLAIFQEPSCCRRNIHTPLK
jgi:hypothetical protein